MSEQTLPCGADADDVLEQVADGRADIFTEHQRGCPHCQAALAEFTALWAPVRALAEEAPIAPPRLVEAVMRSIRQQVRDIWYTLELNDGGAIRIAARVVAVVARDAARRVPDVRVALGRSTQSRMSALVEAATLRHRHPHSAIGVLGRTAVVDLAVAVSFGVSITATARQVQQAVSAELRGAVGLRSVVVNVTVDDVVVNVTVDDVVVDSVP